MTAHTAWRNSSPVRRRRPLFRSTARRPPTIWRRAAFEKKYGVKVRVWRGSSENIVQRAMVEARGGRYDADVIETGAIAMESMHRERLFQEIKTQALSELLPAAILPHREWIGTRFNIFVAAYNTRLIKKGE